MNRCACWSFALLVVGCQRPVTQETHSTVPADGVYAVLRNGLSQEELLPIQKTERQICHDHRYLENEDNVPKRYLVISSEPAVQLALAGPPTAVRGENGLRILLRLQSDAAKALERLTQDQQGRQVAIVLDGEVVTVHKVREVIRGGEVQITSCAPGAAEHLLTRLQAHGGK